MSNPFKKIVKNANETHKDWGTNSNSKTSSRKCENCGAARPKDTNLTTCDYCDFKFMNIHNEIKTDI
ncbi:hypothetical protein PXD56_06405 [Maribacter sp. SA7]|uniref:hypothetical protein n=1 Tax=Maribacter zhoushanensis TaxID=3030012 RepID=UPI0023EC96F8|nr:hypothetical protein [Maribacter zhoushanensis]MDF4202575.1 hypothetical protein [Maribacter zhoushanensis]